MTATSQTLDEQGEETELGGEPGGEPEPLVVPVERDPDEDEDETEQIDEPEGRADHRCEASVNMSGTIFLCGLQEGHEGDHAFQPAGDEPASAEPPAPGEPPLSDADREQAKKLAARAKSYSKAIVEILGDDLAGWLPCELCGPYFPGLRAPVGLPAEVASQLRILLGMPSIGNFAQDPASIACPQCEGQGKTLTGSNVERFSTMICRRCRGAGYLLEGQAPGPDGPQAPTPARELEPEPDREPAPDSDPWGRPKGDPLYGVMPGYESFH